MNFFKQLFNVFKFKKCFITYTVISGSEDFSFIELSVSHLRMLKTINYFWYLLEINDFCSQDSNMQGKLNRDTI